ncbi:MAG: radical SAM protein [Bacteroidales bacterium]|nr:radical SAM protein [Bacteroidales bacterium]
MMLFNQIIYGPVRSRRFGFSLGMNVLPQNSKICTFNCIYCECGWNPKNSLNQLFVDKAVFLETLKEALQQIHNNSIPLDVLTYAGNGEPTLHPDFFEIAKNVYELRNEFASGKQIVLLTNGTTIQEQNIQHSLSYIDIPVFKLDSANEETIRLINQPVQNFSVAEYIHKLKNINRSFVIQTMLLRGQVNDCFVDNTTDKELDKLIETYQFLSPEYVMLYSLDRKPPLTTLQKIENDEMMMIANRIKKAGISVRWV